MQRRFIQSRVCEPHHGAVKFLRGLSNRQPSENPHKPLWYRPLKGQNTGIQIYSCVAKRRVPLILANDRPVTWYTCGPTVYDSSHLGHASCYVKLDIIQRILREHFNANLVTAMNITDIDDKIIRKAEETGNTWNEISRQYETEFWSDLKKLNVMEPNVKIRVTAQIPRIIDFIKKLLDRKLAYVGSDKSVYFDLKKYPLYGKLQNVNVPPEQDNLLDKNLDCTGAKAATEDFALWKAQKSPNEPSWIAPWGAGRPGWHIECSAIASMVFGETLDFHAGGLDLRFPHHENEEAQSCVYHDTKQWVNYWLHTGQLHIKGQQDKMSKSLKNTISISKLLSEYTADEFRMACILSNYRNSVEYGPELMLTARNTLQRFHTFHNDCRAYIDGKKLPVSLDSNAILENLNHTKAQVDDCYKSDFDTARAMNILSEQISSVSRNINSTLCNDDSMNWSSSSCLSDVAAIDLYVQRTLKNLGFTLNTQVDNTTTNNSIIDINSLLEDIVKTRQTIREQALSTKNKGLFQICDDLRDCLKNHGVEIKDHSRGSSWNYSTTTKQ